MSAEASSLPFGLQLSGVTKSARTPRAAPTAPKFTKKQLSLLWQGKDDWHKHQRDAIIEEDQQEVVDNDRDNVENDSLTDAAENELDRVVMRLLDEDPGQPEVPQPPKKQTATDTEGPGHSGAPGPAVADRPVGGAGPGGSSGSGVHVGIRRVVGIIGFGFAPHRGKASKCYFCLAAISRGELRFEYQFNASGSIARWMHTGCVCRIPSIGQRNSLNFLSSLACGGDAVVEQAVAESIPVVEALLA
jgi:hypothetical protein